MLIFIFFKGYIDWCIEVISQMYTTVHSKLVPFASAKINNKNSDASDRLGLSEKTCASIPFLHQEKNLIIS